MDSVENVKKGKSSRLKLILIILLIIVPVLIVTIVYFNNKTFKNKVNNLLGGLPGIAGEHFSSFPAESDDNDKKTYLANHYISLEPAIAADKLYIIKKEDDKLYSEIIRLMNSNSTSKTEEIIKLVRNIESKKGSLSSIYDEVQEGKENLLTAEINRLENQDLLTTINEIEKRIETDEVFEESLPNIITMISQERAADILYYIDETIEDKVLYSLGDNKRADIEGKLLSKKVEQAKLADLASLYEVKPVEVAVEEIGNIEEYTIEELGLIYKNLSVLKSAEILSKLDDDGFIEELYTAIRKEEQLNGEEASITNDISKSMQFITEYNNKIDDLVKVYGKMNPDKAAKIVEKMMTNNNTVTALEIDSEPVFEISDASIIIDVLSRMGNKTLSSIMNYISTDKASTLTQMLVRP